MLLLYGLAIRTKNGSWRWKNDALFYSRKHLKIIRIVTRNLADLIRLGANLYEIGRFPMKLATKEPEGTTPSRYALSMGVNKVWETALRKAGYNPEEVYAEDERRFREYVRHHGGVTNAVELQENDQRNVLRKRRARAAVDEE